MNTRGLEMHNYSLNKDTIKDYRSPPKKIWWSLTDSVSYTVKTYYVIHIVSHNNH